MPSHRHKQEKQMGKELPNLVTPPWQLRPRLGHGRFGLLAQRYAHQHYTNIGIYWSQTGMTAMTYRQLRRMCREFGFPQWRDSALTCTQVPFSDVCVVSPQVDMPSLVNFLWVTWTEMLYHTHKRSRTVKEYNIKIKEIQYYNDPILSYLTVLTTQCYYP